MQKIQKDVDKWTGQFKPQYWPPHEILARLTDIIFTVACMANSQGINLTKEWA